jgi:hypothetical protein
MKVVSYKNVVPITNNSPEKTYLLMHFISGVRRCGDTAIYYDGYDVQDSEVALIQGWQHEKGKTAKHLKLRQDIIDKQLSKNRYVISADSNLFLYANPSNAPHHYLRYSFNGVFPTTGIYCDKNPNPKRWQQISRDLNIDLLDNKQWGKNIVLCCQRNGGWSMGSYDTVDWILDTVKKIRKYSDRRIIIRGHPKDKKAQKYLNDYRIHSLPNIKVKLNTPLEEDLHKAWAVVNHNSSSIVGPIIQGYHAFATDPKNSQCREVVNTDFSKIESPELFDRKKWLERISMFHWKFSELEDGSCWQHMKEYI